MSTFNADIQTNFGTLFDYLNGRLFGGEIDVPVFECAFRRKVGFRFSPKTHEFFIGAHLCKMTYRDMMVDFLHEMIHMYNHYKGVVDHGSNQYHKESFAKVAVKTGLYVQRHRTRAWSIVSLTPPAGGEFLAPEPDDREYLERTIDRAPFDFELLQTILAEIKTEANANRKLFQLKYECKCPPPHNNIRSGRRPDGRHPLRVTCDVCKSPFTPAVGEDPLD